MLSFLSHPRRPWRLLSALVLVLAAGASHAQSDDDGSAGDPPDRVARLSYLAGAVGFLPAGADRWSDASVNRPLTRGDRLSTGHDARIELELDRASLRADRDTDLGVLRLDDQTGQLELTRGTLSLSVRGLAEGQSYEIDTPAVALVVDRPGVFRVDVDDRGGGTEITALEGQATVYGEGGARRALVGGHSYRFDDSSLAQLVESYSGARDAFDLWCSDRDARYVRSPSRQYVSEDVVGYEDLDQYGQWQSSDDYGQVWYPAIVGSDWAPYRQGHWAYVAPWGWSWVDDAPWGFAPYHYGRWIRVHGRWGWIPGPRELRAVYAPALVAFVGGSGWSVSIGSGAPIGWFPLGPGDIYDPWYATSASYYRRVNRHNIRWGRHHDGDHDHRIDEHYRHHRDGRGPDQDYANRYAPYGITAMSREAFVHARRADTHRLKVDPGKLRAAPVLAGGIDLQPVRASLAPRREGGTRSVPVGRFDRAVIAHNAPPAGAGQLSADRIGAGNRPAPVRVPQPAAMSRFPQARGELGSARDAAVPGVRSSRFAHPQSQPARFPAARGNAIDPERAAPRRLPEVPRIVRAPQGAAAAPETPTMYRPPREAARPAVLPTPARIEPARQWSAGRWQGERAERGDVRMMRAPAVRAPASEPAMRRFEPRAEPRREEYARPAPMPSSRPFQPPAREPAPRQAAPDRSAPAARPFTPTARPSQPAAAPAARGDDAGTPAMLHYKHR
ncbi:DUF6600 domain-containing protein [Dyella sp.]|jgi:hypothetical protein|uniref:DUF6600 domain-containing protein n=1 Tax=Dyella sp. TaxID=1869338 RepID=UPI002D788B41|nr:DUF6600 domain-containing protein [Dyella sp.]HET6431619.1 DUF6600 domain-containing protein [Dyella sp.]